ncbi:MAG TPA: DUF1707 domain-containing protein [Acidimicrobiales bacterium]|nr:DUF1707 domain-containing protein [Acidimicrobiales bacterium]
MRYRWDPPYPTTGHRSAPTDADVRASDAERSEVADRLSRHFADGRLDQVEFKVRLDKAMEATTRSDLDGLFDDLPRLETEPEPRQPSHRRRRLVPFIVIIALITVAAGSTLSWVHVPWLLFAFVALFLWYRVGRHHVGPHRRSEIDR